MKFNLFDLGVKTYSGGAYPSAHGFCMPPASPLFDEYASAVNDPPYGIGKSLECGWYGVWVDNNELYAIVQTTDGNGKCINHYTLNTANKPLTMTWVDDAVPVTNLDIDAKDFQTSRYHLFDHNNRSVLINCWYSSGAKNSNMGRWEMDRWGEGFSDTTKTWIDVPSSYGSVEAGKICRNGLPLLDIDRDRLYIASTGSRKVQTRQWSDGALLGEFTFNDAWSTTSPFRLVGIDKATGYVIGGSDYGVYDAGPPELDAGDGAVWAWNTSNPNAWTKEGAQPVIPSGTDSWQRGRFWSYGHTPSHLYYYYGRFYPIQPHICDLIGFGEDEIACVEFVPQYWGYTYGVQVMRRLNLTTGEEYQYPLAQCCSYARSGIAAIGLMLNDIVVIDGQPWLIGGVTGGLDQFHEQPKHPEAGGVMAVHAGVGRIEIDLSDDLNPQIGSRKFQPDHLLIKVAVDGVDSEFSTHEGKWRASYILNGVECPYWRAGSAELGNLDKEVHGIPAWPEVSSADTFVVVLECCSGFFRNWAPAKGNPGDRDTPRLPVANPGPPNDVVAVLYGDISIPNFGNPIIYITKGPSDTVVIG